MILFLDGFFMETSEPYRRNNGAASIRFLFHANNSFLGCACLGGDWKWKYSTAGSDDFLYLF